jgi:hypothetical protein
MKKVVLPALIVFSLAANAQKVSNKLSFKKARSWKCKPLLNPLRK